MSNGKQDAACGKRHVRSRPKARPLVSVVMPSFNQAKFIPASIGSVLGQDYPNVELIVGDGGSTDGTVEFLRTRAKSDNRLRWFSRPDSGPAEAINNALSLARGTIIGWLNSDDLYTPGAIRRAVDSFAQHPGWIMLYGKGQHINENGEVINNYPTLPPSTPVRHFANGCFICQPSVFFKSTMPMLLGGLDQSLKASFDFDYWLRAFLAFPGRIGFIDAVQAQSRLHQECITMKMREKVAVEGMRIVSRHLGEAPVHWITTYIEELMTRPDISLEIPDLKSHIRSILEEIGGTIDPSSLEYIKNTILTDERFAK